MDSAKTSGAVNYLHDEDIMAFLDTAAQRCTATFLCLTTKLDIGVAPFRSFRRVSRFCVDHHNRLTRILKPVFVPYLRGLRGAVFQQSNARTLVARRILIHFDTESVLLLAAWSIRTPDLSPIENTKSWVAVRLSRHRFPINTVDEVSIDLKQHGMTCLYLLSKSSSSRCLTGLELFLQPETVTVCTPFEPLVYL
ncbi:hypothetical protein TNCV_4443921 [Trichonephila clavipes]|nr:hypothetical protein TNCV_4443921 [Trichonephila clavipes]